MKRQTRRAGACGVGGGMAAVLGQTKEAAAPSFGFRFLADSQGRRQRQSSPSTPDRRQSPGRQGDAGRPGRGAPGIKLTTVVKPAAWSSCAARRPARMSRPKSGRSGAASGAGGYDIDSHGKVKSATNTSLVITDNGKDTHSRSTKPRK